MTYPDGLQTETIGQKFLYFNQVTAGNPGAKNLDMALAGADNDLLCKIRPNAALGRFSSGPVTALSAGLQPSREVQR